MIRKAGITSTLLSKSELVIPSKVINQIEEFTAKITQRQYYRMNTHKTIIRCGGTNPPKIPIIAVL